METKEQSVKCPVCGKFMSQQKLNTWSERIAKDMEALHTTIAKQAEEILKLKEERDDDRNKAIYWKTETRKAEENAREMTTQLEDNARIIQEQAELIHKLNAKVGEFSQKAKQWENEWEKLVHRSLWDRIMNHIPD